MTEREIAILDTKVDRLIEDVRFNTIRITRQERLVYIALGALMLIQFSPMLMNFIGTERTPYVSQGSPHGPTE